MCSMAMRSNSNYAERRSGLRFLYGIRDQVNSQLHTVPYTQSGHERSYLVYPPGDTCMYPDMDTVNRVISGAL